MHVLHGGWIPETTTAFVQEGSFYLWVESSKWRKYRQISPRKHPRHLAGKALTEFLTNELKLQPAPGKMGTYPIHMGYFWLPSDDKGPLPSPELSRYLEEPIAESFKLALWQVACCQVTVLTGSGFVNPLVLLLETLYRQVVNGVIDCQIGSDLLFWYHYSRSLPNLIQGDHYIPSLKYRKRQERFEVYTGWEALGQGYEDAIATHASAMPLACRLGQATPTDTPRPYDPETLLRHFSECWLTDIVTQTPLPRTFLSQVEGTIIEDCAGATFSAYNGTPERLQVYQQWQAWRDRICRTQTDSAFYLGFRLDAPNKPEAPWPLALQVILKADPSVQLNLLDYWRMEANQQWAMKLLLGENFEQQLLLNLGQAARIYPLLWEGLETDQPIGVLLDMDAAVDFLQEAAWVLESAGYKVIVPSWWTAAGRRRLKLRLNARSKQTSNDKSKTYFSLSNIVEYEYQLALGDETITQKEWQQLVKAKTPMVQIRGQWVVLDPSKLEEMRTLLEQKPQETSLLGFMRVSAEQGEDLEVVCDRNSALNDMLDPLNNPSQIEITDDPDRFHGSLRNYQKRGLAWISYLEQLGINGCLADDMGLGKTVQVIARLLQEREDTEAGPTLLICPTSVIGNWFHELQKFAPSLSATIHHGPQRTKEPEPFAELCQEQDVVITSFSLARRDSKLLQTIDWHRIVLDEAQNIKNPQAAQTKAINQIAAPHRLALTGTPIENRLMDLWSIFHFLNPGYLGNQKQFKEQFESPIQREQDTRRSQVLKQLVEPFILRRVKTDQRIIQDLPDKIEQKLFCNLTKEQASLYAATVKDVMAQIQAADGIKRKGIMLATLLKLKQICNHPRQFLQDDSEFSPTRSHKLSRLTEMVSEALEEGESLLIFSQFTEIGAALEQYFHQTCHYNTYYLHGGTSRKRREQMIAEFQHEQTPPSVFILSLKAGGVGITLTKANHVFHFDRWWNPAVEDQATDRAFRIGQQKKVFVHKFVSVGTIEERIDEMIEDKKKLAGAIVGADESWLTELDNESFKQLITLNKNAVL
ncbi:MAG: DEAD/DEAH box helicase [Cyanobacteria bacterium J06648_16]